MALTGCKGGDAPSTEPKAGAKKVDALPPVDIKPGEEAQLMPLTEGNQWTYKVDEALGNKGGVNRGSSEVTFKISKVVDGPDGKDATIEVSAGGKLTNKQIWRVSKDGIFQVAAGLKLDKLTPPQPLVKFPIKEGDKYSWTGVGTVAAKPAQMKADYVIKGSRLVDTEMGQVQALLVESVTEITIDKNQKGASALSMWFKPGTGLVRIQESTRFPTFGRQAVLRLKNFAPKQ